MINEIINDCQERMEKSIKALKENLSKIRTGRAHPSILDSITVDYYGSQAPIKQLANINIEDARTLAISVWEKSMITEVERAIMNSDLGLNPSTAGVIIRVPMPALTEETRRQQVKQARNEAENAKISVRNARRDANSDIKEMEKEKMISEDEMHAGEERVQKLTNQFITTVDETLKGKENDLMEI